jgi:hypothetical protein
MMVDPQKNKIKQIIKKIDSSNINLTQFFRIVEMKVDPSFSLTDFKLIFVNSFSDLLNKGKNH